MNHSMHKPNPYEDPGRLKYRVHNIYLNFLETFGRIPPDKPITLHQKALFTLWMSAILLWTIMQLCKIHKILRHRNEQNYDTVPDLEENNIGEEEDELSEEEIKIEDEINIQYSPSKDGLKKLTSSNSYSPCKTFQPLSGNSYSPSKTLPSPSLNTSKDIGNRRKDYLDESAFNEHNVAGESFSLTDINIKAKASEVESIEAKLHKGINKLTDGNLEALNEDNKENASSESIEELSKKPPLLESIKTAIHEVFTAQDKDQPTFEKFVLKIMFFGCFMFYFFLTDYLHIWPKVAKQYSRDMFVFLFFLLVFVAVIFSIRKTSDKLLNRDQTEEWKGWMQVQFVWYHYFDAQETFNSIRCYVGGYVWMTGFGNYIYFSTRKDYSIFRLLKMLFRLNFLVFCIMAVTNHEFVRYYICAMHTYWFLSVWAVMVVLNRYNSSKTFLLLKFGIYAAINAMIWNIPGASEKVFTPFKWALHDKRGTLDYWKYRAWLDHWSTLVGIIFAFNYERIDEFYKYLDKDDPQTKQKRETIRYTVTSALLAIFAIWFYYILRLPKHEYLKVHPFTSPVPIVLYALLRNIHPILRTYNLNLFTWLGKITLETYLSQIHLYMIGDAQAILVYLPRYPMLNFAISTLIYISVSYVLFHLTVFFSGYIFPRNIKVVIKNIICGSIWLGLCYVVSFVLTHEHLWRSDKSGLEFLIWKVEKY